MTVKTTVIAFHDKTLFDNFDKADELPKENLFEGTSKSNNILDLFQRLFHKRTISEIGQIQTLKYNKSYLLRR